MTEPRRLSLPRVADRRARAHQDRRSRQARNRLDQERRARAALDYEPRATHEDILGLRAYPGGGHADRRRRLDGGAPACIVPRETVRLYDLCRAGKWG